MSEEKLKQVQQALEEKEKNNQKEESKRKLLCQCEEVIRYFKAMRTKGWA